MKTVLNILSCLIIFSFSTPASSKQADSDITKNLLSGVITNSETGEPIPHAEVFISGTTIGTITNIDGRFSVEAPFLPCTFVASHVSYESFILVIQEQNSEMLIKLVPSVNSVKEVQVTSRNKRKRNLRFFYSHFVPDNRNKIEILNDSVLQFARTDTMFIASSKVPLVIVNHFLGYRIKAILKEFRVFTTDGPNGPVIPLNSPEGGEVLKLSGYYFYEPITNVSEKELAQFVENRRLHYFGSYRHFLKAIYDGKPELEGYEIIAAPANVTLPGFVEAGQPNLANFRKNIIPFKIEGESLKVTYYYDDHKYPIPNTEFEYRFHYYTLKSTIYPGNGIFHIRENGTSPDVNFVIDGPLAPRNFSNSLPEDYEPPKK